MLSLLKGKIKFILPCLIFLILLTACNNPKEKKTKASSESNQTNIDKVLKTPNWVANSPIQQSPNFNKNKKVKAVVNFMATGDNLYHDSVITDGKQINDSYDYNYIYKNIKEAVQSSDLAVVNQETPIAGNVLGVQGYPTFNTPEEVGQSLVDTGFNIVTQATNHIMDMGLAGVQNTRDYWKKHSGIVSLGINENQEERNEIKSIKKNGIEFALLNYTYGTNGKNIEPAQSWAVNVIDKEAIKNDVKKAKKILI
ncbi:capsule biosynthesis protein capA [Bacillus cereus VD142]|uniref:Capsule biosynthesis protein capA n=1 Tax=Bacillus cereus VD142 TaxID=718224 RepID=S2LLH5_BACCE|nr:capsule biosynthesis protein capA [Bacillus cereus VD142]